MSSNTHPHVLVVEDEANIRELVSLHLRLEHAIPVEAQDGRTALDLARTRRFDLVILDLMLPGLDGLTVCRAIRKDSHNQTTPILMLTARREENDKVLGLDSGADDYLTKPFGVRELMARVRALLRRTTARDGGDLPATGPITYRHIDIDPARRRVRVGARDVELTSNEFQLLSVLLSNPGIVFSREALLNRVWNDETFVTVRSVDTLVKRLRKKVEADPADPEVILTVWGTGYKAADALKRWRQSLYWRIALGLFAFVAVMLAAEGALFLWISDRLAGAMPARSPRQLAGLVSRDVGAALARDANLNLETYLRDQYKDVVQTFFVVLRDGRIASNHDDVPAEIVGELRADNTALLTGRGGRRRGRGPGERPEGFEGGFPQRPFRSGGGSGPLGEMAPLFVDGAQVGRVVIWAGDRPFWRIVRQLGPTMAVIAATVLGVGTTLIALVVFGPVRRRLKGVQAATERLGAGDLSARAPEHGGDEVASLARSFNQMADELSARARALEASDRTRRQLMADVSHELMTPLTAMRGYIETLTMPEVPLDPQTRQRYMGIITDETHRLEQIIGDLLDLARLEGGGMTLRRERADVEQLFKRVGARHERELTDRRVALTTRVDPSVKSVVGDPDRLEQALQNLAANALRHAPEAGQIRLTAEREGSEVVLTVRDNGPGIPSEHLPLIFNRFYKADVSRRAAGGGSGLGLSIAKAIVEWHGGTITARNDDGAVFEIRLPSSGADAESEQVASSK